MFTSIGVCVCVFTVAPYVPLQAGMGAGVWSQLDVEVSQSTQLLDGSSARNCRFAQTFHEVLECELAADVGAV